MPGSIEKAPRESPHPDPLPPCERGSRSRTRPAGPSSAERERGGHAQWEGEGGRRTLSSTLGSPGILRRFIILTTAATFAMFTLWAVVREVVDAPPGDYEVRQGDILLGDGKFTEAIGRFEAALAVSPGHRGAMMGRAIALLETGRQDEAEAAFSDLITFLSGNLAADDATGTAVLAAAFANRGILRDRSGRHDAALADYRQALAIDAGAVEGPGLFHRILYGNAQPSTIAKRADYIEAQLALPEEQRLLRVPEVDARQRMHKP